MKKTLSKISHWYNQDLIIGAVSMLVVLLVTELLFTFPSSMIHGDMTPPKQKIDIVRDTKEADTSLSLDESPVFCTKEYRPVCGADGKTYGNACMANAAKTIIASEGECQSDTQDSTPSTDTIIPDPEGATSSYMEPSQSTVDYSDSKKYHTYTNSSIGYSMSFPAYSYYQGYGARSGAAHSMAIALDDAGIASFDSAPVRVWFYRSEPANPPSTDSVKTANGIVYVSSSLDNPKVQKIVSDILASAK